MTFNPAIYRLVADMAELRGHVGDWPVDTVPDEQPPRGLRRTYTRARKLAGESINTESIQPLTEVLDELATQLGVISKACPAMVKAQRKLLTRAAEELHDLQQAAALNKALRAELGQDASKSLPAFKPLSKQAADRLGTDLADALAETPAAFMKRVQAYWVVWRGGSA